VDRHPIRGRIDEFKFRIEEGVKMLTEGFIYSQIKRYNRRLLIVTLILIALTAAMANELPRYWYNLQRGPFQLSTDQLSRIRKVDSLKEYYVRVKGQKLFRLLREDGFYLLEMDNALLVIKGKVDEKNLEFYGELKNLTDDDQIELYRAFSKRKVDGTKVMPHIYRVYLEAGSFSSSKNFEYIVIAILKLLIIRNITAFCKRNSEPGLHPICKYLSQFGSADAVIQKINGEVNEAGEAAAKASVIVTDTWIIAKKFFKLQFIALSDVVWAYQKVTSHRYNLIPVGKTHELIIYTQNQEKHELKVRSGPAGETAINLIRAKAPWAFVGYSEKFESMWLKNRSELLQIVRDRSKQVEM
jgi:Putative transmembrane protein precursor.